MRDRILDWLCRGAANIDPINLAEEAAKRYTNGEFYDLLQEAPTENRHVHARYEYLHKKFLMEKLERALRGEDEQAARALLPLLDRFEYHDYTSIVRQVLTDINQKIAPQASIHQEFLVTCINPEGELGPFATYGMAEQAVYEFLACYPNALCAIQPRFTSTTR